MVPPAIPFAPALVDFFQSPVALQLAAAGLDLRPASTRAFGCRVESDACTLRVSVIEAQSGRFLDALEPGVRIAVNASHVVDFRGVQAKGRLLERRPASPAEHELADAYSRALVRAFGGVGVPEAACRGLRYSGPLVVVRLRVDVLFEQTPGPGAGQKLEAPWARL